MAYETIDFKADGPIARITLDRPDRLNSFTVQMHEELRDALGRLEGCRVLVLTGAGRGFCAGQDLNDRAVAPGKAIDLEHESMAKLEKMGVKFVKNVDKSGFLKIAEREIDRTAADQQRQHRFAHDLKDDAQCRALVRARQFVKALASEPGLGLGFAQALERDCCR